MDQPSDDVSASDAVKVGKGSGLGLAGVWRSLVERAVGAMRVVMPDVGRQDLFEVAAVEDQEPIEALAADAADPALDVGVRAGCANGCPALAFLAAPSIGGKFWNKPLKNPNLGREETRATWRTPETEDIRRRGIAVNFKLVGWNPLLDGDRGKSRDRAFDPYINPPMNIPRGSNGDITLAGNCVYVGSFVGYQTALIVDVSKPHRPTVVGEVPGLPPGVGNGIEGIEASDDLLVIDQRGALGGLGFPIPTSAGLDPTFRGITIYDIGERGSNCRQPRLVARYAYRSNSGLPGDM